MAVSLIPAASAINGTLPSAQLPVGSVLQVVNAAITTQNSTSSSTFVATALTASITPKFSTSKILVLANFTFDNNASGGAGAFAIYRNSTQLGDSTYGSGLFWGQSSRVQAPTNLSLLDSPATTSSTTYTVYHKVTGGSNIGFNIGAYATMTLLEIAG